MGGFSYCQRKVSHIKKIAVFKSIYFSYKSLSWKITVEQEVKHSISSTTHNRYKILENKISKIRSSSDVEKIYYSHDEYPNSICNHFNNNSQDPSATLWWRLF